ncbi:MAG TPA: hypothetical protein VG276_00695 [Actinomycetes bacterium]|nr:hypothetical protein [Actinomycetes bacterium]
MPEPTRPPDPAELRAVAAAERAATGLARAVGRAAGAGIVIDDEIVVAVATITSWSSWLGKRAAAESTEQP